MYVRLEIQFDVTKFSKSFYSQYISNHKIFYGIVV